MNGNLVQTLEQIMEPLVRGGMQLALAEGIAKVEAYNRGMWDGVACDRCREMFPLLYPYREVGDDRVIELCLTCGGRKAMVMEADARAVRLMARGKGRCAVCGNDGATFDGRCWRCSHRALRCQTEVRSYQHRDLPQEDQ